MNVALRIWRQADLGAAGRFVRYQLDDVSADATADQTSDINQSGN